MNEPPFTRPFLKMREAPSEGDFPKHCGGKESPHGGASLTPARSAPRLLLSPLCAAQHSDSRAHLFRTWLLFWSPIRLGPPRARGLSVPSEGLWGRHGTGPSPVFPRGPS